MDEFMPQKTLVIAPGKMAAFYSLHRLESEVFPFTGLFPSLRRHTPPLTPTQPDIFRSRQGTVPARLAELYQQLACEYYLVPAEPSARPTIPGLTLAGFTRWLTLATRAHPSEEARRLAKLVAALPINADSPLDGKPERLPKQLSRRLLPDKPDRQAHLLFTTTLKAHLLSLIHI